VSGQGTGRPLQARPLEPAERRLWLLDRLTPGLPADQAALAWRLRGPLAAARLRRCLDELVARHQALRTGVSDGDGDGTPHALLAPPLPVPFEEADLAALDPAERAPRALQIATTVCRRGFDLAAPPLLRAALVRLEPEEHLLVVAAHRLAADDWSLGVLAAELSGLDAALAAGAPPPAPPPLQYGEAARLQADGAEAALAWWESHLAGLPDLELPADRPRPARGPARAGVARRTLAPALAERLGDGDGVRRELGASAKAVALAAFQALLQRYSGQDDLALGVPLRGRDRPELAGVVGPLANTVPLRGDLGGDRSFREAVRRAGEALRQAGAHGAARAERLIERLGRGAPRDRHPLYQVLFDFDPGDGPARRLRLPGLEATPWPLDAGATRLDLAVHAALRPGAAPRLELVAVHADELLDGWRVDALLAHYETLLAAALARPDRPLSRLPLLAPAQRQGVLALAPGRGAVAARPAPGAACLHHLVAAQAAATPGRIAVRDEREALSYRELVERARRLARRLRQLGAGPRAPVGVCLRRGAALPVAALAVLQAGAAYLPLDPEYPAERLELMLRDSGERPVVVTQADLLRRLPDRDAATLVLDDPATLAALTRPLRSAGPQVPTGPDDLAYLIYTSGSTGRPKGVEVPHGGAVQLLEAMRAEPGFGPDDVLVAATSFSFDIALVELFLPLVTGGTVVLASERTVIDTARLGELLRRSAATWFQATPTGWRRLLEAGWRAARPMVGLAGGEVLDGELAERLERAGVTPLWNGYGPTEATVYASFQRVPARAGQRPLPIGRAVPGTRLYVVDRHGEPVPVGVPGELWIGGAGVARGYRNRPALTAERFVPDRFGGRPGGRLYRTGDLARWRRDGSVDFLGRADQQVKIRGFRVEPGEVEAALAAHPAVAKAVVVVRHDLPGDDRLVAFLVPAAAAVPAVEELRALLGRTLPQYLVPALFVAVDALPCTPSGKTDRAALSRMPLPAPLDPSAGGDQARSATERDLVKIWTALLGRGRVGVHDDFFELGGDSLLATRLVTAVRERFNAELAVPDVFDAPTVAELATAVERSLLAAVGTSELARMLEELEA
jgi:amino acid adenylation domain-containing protein